MAGERSTVTAREEDRVRERWKDVGCVKGACEGVNMKQNSHAAAQEQD